MATHSSILVCRISWTEEPGGLQSIGSQRARHDSAQAQGSNHLEIEKHTFRGNVQNDWLIAFKKKKTKGN